MSVAFYMDVHIPRAVTVALRFRSVDVLTAQEHGGDELDDRQLLDQATKLGRVLVSQDADLVREGVRRQASGEIFSGVVYVHQLRITIGHMVEDLELIAKATSAGDWQGRIEYLPLS